MANRLTPVPSWLLDLNLVRSCWGEGVDEAVVRGRDGENIFPDQEISTAIPTV